MDEAEAARVEAAGQAILDVLAGLTVPGGMCAQSAALGTAAAGIAQINGGNIDDALQMIDCVAADARATAIGNFGSIEGSDIRDRGTA